jgi:hypothetical protein
VSARLRDRTFGTEYEVGPYDGIASFIVTQIDYSSQAVIIVDAKMAQVTIKVGD